MLTCKSIIYHCNIFRTFDILPCGGLYPILLDHSYTSTKFYLHTTMIIQYVYDVFTTKKRQHKTLVIIFCYLEQQQSNDRRRLHYSNLLKSNIILISTVN
jgi:hypothetical protein